MSKKQRTANSRFAKAGVSYFYESEVLNSSFVHLMKFCGENRHHRQSAKRCAASNERNTKETINRQN